MYKRIHAFSDFVKLFFRHALFVREVLVGLLALLLLGGVLFSYLENISLSSAIYFAFITDYHHAPQLACANPQVLFLWMATPGENWASICNGEVEQ